MVSSRFSTGMTVLRRVGWVLLQLVAEQSRPGGTHVDFRVDDVAEAVGEIEAIGGVVVPPGLYAPDESSSSSGRS